MAATFLSSSNSSVILLCAIQYQYASSQPRLFLSVPQKMLCIGKKEKKASNQNRLVVVGVTQGSAESSKSEETIPSWAKPDSDEPPPWARDETNNTSASQQGFEIPFFVYLLASAITAIAAIGSIFEYVNQRPVFGVLSSDSVFYAPLLGFFVFTGIPSAAFLWFKSVQVANKEAEEQDKRDGYL